MVAGFRIGRGRDSAQQRQQQGRGGARGGRPYGQSAPPHPQQQWSYGPRGAAQRGGRGDEPEYFGPGPYAGRGHDRYADDPGHTQAFGVGEAPDAYGPGPGYGPEGYDPYGDGSGYVNTYRAGQAPPPPSGPRLHWKDLLRGIIFRPGPTFWQMRDYPVWGPALIVTFIYGLVAVFGLDQAREQVINATLSNSVPWVISTGIAVVISGLLLGAVTHTLARQLGGVGAWQPTVGLSMLIMSLTDAPRLVIALFLGGAGPLVQLLGWATWVVAAALFTSMVSKSHDLRWPRALAASSIQLIALLALIKLGTL